MPKSYRIRTQVGVDKYISVNLEQDFEFLEILSLKILSNDVYTRYCSDYGVVVGRVLVNGGYGVPNARVSIFIPLQDEDLNNPIISELYPYTSITSRNEEGYRYNLLPKEPSYLGHQATGTFPSREDVLMDQSYIEVYDRYYRYTAKTNESGDFMIFGVPIGEQTLVMDVDVSDIGCFSLAPQDLIQQGLATEAQIDGATFRTSTNLDSLPQIINLNYNVDVRPLWGDTDFCQIGITRVDFDLTKLASLRIEPYAVFMGSIISTTNDDALSIGCKPKNDTGNLCELITGPGQILAIRQTIFNDDQNLPILEQYKLDNDGKVIDSDGSFVVSIPMNLDYITTNEFGEQVFSNNPNVGIPTKGKYRFKFRWENKEKTLSLNRFQSDIIEKKKEVGLSDDDYQGNFQRAGFLVPNVKEYGWQQSNSDPLNLPPQTTTYTIPAPPAGSPTPYPAQAGTVLTYFTNVGLQLDNSVNNLSYQILIDGQPYFGGVESIFIPGSQPGGSTFQIIGVPLGNSVQTFTFIEYPEDLFNLYRSYAFSLDWDDYVNPQEAITTQDTFYEFNYNKVYTTAMFLDRYKNGIGRAKHLGIKEIDNRTCKTTNNTFPVNDVIRNFDPIFFLFNLLVNILLLPFVVLLWLAHFVAFAWPVLKYLGFFLFIFLGAMNAYQAYQNGVLLADLLSFASASAANPALAAIVASYTQQVIASQVQNIILSSIYFILAAATLPLLLIRLQIPRLGLPMINYPDCTSCGCEGCKESELDDDFDLQSLQNEINQQVQSSTPGGNLVLNQPLTFLAPIMSPAAYGGAQHPNYNQVPLTSTNPDDGPFSCSGPLTFGEYRSLQYALQNGDIDVDVASRAVQDFQRLFSGYDVISSSTPIKLTPNEGVLLNAPQPFLFSAREINAGPDRRWFAFPNNQTYPQKLNEFNLRDKYFGVNAPNRIKVSVNPQIPGSGFYEDQIIILLSNPGTKSVIPAGSLFTFQDPEYSDTLSPNRLVNLTGATLNQFNTNSVTGVTFTGTTAHTVNYANWNSITNTVPLQANIIITGASITQVPSFANTGPTTLGVNGYEENYLKFATDLEYFQTITGMTVGDFITLSNTSGGSLFPFNYLLHKIQYVVPGCDLINNTGPNHQIITYPTPALYTIPNYQNYEIIIAVRGVDPHTPKQNIKYDLSKIFGNSSYGVKEVEGSYFLNVPIQAYPTTPAKPKSHLTGNNQGYNLYFPSYSFTISNATPTNTNYTPFTSTLPYFYLATDDSTAAAGNLYSTYSPPIFTIQTQNFTNTWTTSPFISNNINYTTPFLNYPFLKYFGGGPFIGGNYDSNILLNPTPQPYYFTTDSIVNGVTQQQQRGQYYYVPVGTYPNFPYLNGLYSPAYYRSASTHGAVNFNDRTKIVMRSDRLPTSTSVLNGADNRTGYGMHQNSNFTFFTANGVEAPAQLFIGLDLIGGSYYDLDGVTSALTETLQCEGMVPLACYSGDGYTYGVIPYGSSSTDCSVPENRVVGGCYCLLNKGDDFLGKPRYLIGNAFKYDLKLLLEWKVRFTMNLALCRGVFAQVFQNNWVNGVLYMYAFNTRKIFGLDPNQPNYTNRKFFKKYCDDVIVYNDITNNFYYRSSPWSTTTNSFIGKDSPATSGFLNNLLQFPGAAYNVKQIQFPTTIADLGPRDSFIREICSNPAFGIYYSDQIDPTSYKDNSNILLMSFLSRLLNTYVNSQMQPTTIGQNFVEGVSIKQFFDSDRKGYRIDGDIAQMLSINSEWKVTPFATENLPAANANSYIFLGVEGPLGVNPTKPVFGVFFSSSTSEVRYRRIMSPGIETYSEQPLIQEVFGYQKSQTVPHYKWLITQGNSIFGSENNNWYTDVTTPNVGATGFFQKQYQDLNFFSLGEKYITQTSQFGYITNFTPGANQVPTPNPFGPPQGPSGVMQGQPLSAVTQSVVVGAPYHFYFGLINGSTAMDKFYKLYVPQY